MNLPFRRLLISLPPLLVAFGLSARAAPSPASLDVAVAAEMAKWHSPGAAVAVTRNGHVVMAKGYGLADRERSIPVTPDTPFFIGSMSKQFTAAAVMLLELEGRIALDAPAATYLPRLRGVYAPITVRQLLTHTSGIQRDFRGEHGHSLIGDDLFTALDSAPLAFTPGEKAAYSNTNYILLGLAVEAVSGKTLGEFLSSRLFEPLRMTSTRLVTPGAAPKRVAVGYEWTDDTYEVVASVPHRFGAGGMVSTVNDLARWDAALSAGAILSKEVLATQWTGAPVSPGGSNVIGSDDAGRLLEVGMGWFTSLDFGHRVVHHGGNIDGYSSQIDRFVDDRVTVIVLANNEAHAAINIARPVIATFVAGLDSVTGASLAQRARLAFDRMDYTEAARLDVAALDRGATMPAIAFHAARCYAMLKQSDGAFALLDRAATLGYRDLTRLLTERWFEPLRGDPRWSAIVARITSNRDLR